MQAFQFPQEIYNQSLREVEGAQLSPREIEVIAHILLGEETRQISHTMAIGEEIVEDRIAYTYKISDSTVESHIKNIYEKLSPFAARYRENLKNIIRKRDKIKFLVAQSDKKTAFERYCQGLKAENLFLKHLDRIFQKYASLMNFRETITCQVKYWNPFAYETGPLNLAPIAYTYLARHLNDRKPKNSQKIIATTLTGGSWDKGGQGGDKKEEKTSYSICISCPQT